VPVWRVWSLTRSELVLSLRGAALSRKRERKAALWVAWHTAALQRAKRLPMLETLMSDRRDPTPDELAAARAAHEEVVAEIEAAQKKAG
jgi:hypothetical protein